jgi:prophage regulatory protein
MSDRLIRIREVSEITSLARSTIYKYIQDGTFPKQKGGMTRMALWRLSDVQNWVASDELFDSSTQN